MPPSFYEDERIRVKNDKYEAQQAERLKRGEIQLLLSGGVTLDEVVEALRDHGIDVSKAFGNAFTVNRSQ